MAKILIAYASKRGSTAEIAQTIAETLRAAGHDVDCAPTHEVRELDPYDAVVLGSAVYIRRWRRDARHFLRRHRKALAQRPLWVFSSGPIGDPERDAAAWQEPAHTIAKVEALGAREHVVFGGRVPEPPHGPAQRAMVEGIPPQYRDRRDWAAIRGWAQGIAAALRDPVLR